MFDEYYAYATAIFVVSIISALASLIEVGWLNVRSSLIRENEPLSKTSLLFIFKLQNE